MQDLWIAALDAIAARIVDAVARDEPPSAAAASFLLRHYIGAERDDLREPLGLALAQALAAASRDADPLSRAAWLALFVEAAAIADDERILSAARELASDLRDAWPIDSRSAAGLTAATASVDACLRASSLFDPSEIVPPAIDELERCVGGAYRPGDRLVGAPVTHVHAASALLTAYELTGRLPYSMLAEELMQPCRRIGGADVAASCEAARVLCRLAALHDDADYRAAAVLAPEADYRGDATRILNDHAALARADQVAHAALYGLALRERMSLR